MRREWLATGPDFVETCQNLTPPVQRQRPSPMLIAGALLLALAMAFAATYLVAGARVGVDGRTQQPFALIPLAWLSGLAGAALVAIAIRRGR